MSIKNLTYYLCMFLAVSTLLFTSACGDDDVVIDDVDGISVGDGWYMAATGVDPTAGAQLSAEVVEEKDFGSQERAGFVSGYVWLDAADYNLVQVTAKAITNTIGGDIALAPVELGGACDVTEYSVVSGAAVDGPAFAIATAGLYKVTYDETIGEMVVFRIETPSIIGSGTPGGWGSDTEFTRTSLDATGGAWEATEVELREGQWKLRFNCNWNIDRRTSTLDPNNVDFDSDNPFDPTKGYMMFTNLGGSANALVAGGANIDIADTDEGIYTVDVTWDGANGQWAVGLTKTGDVAPITFVPDDNEWALTGDATPNGWADDDATNDPIGVDHDMNYSGVDAGTYTWTTDMIALVEGGMKFRANDDWAKNMGCGTTPSLTVAGPAAANFDCDGENIRVNVAGNYNIILSTSDDGDNYTANITQL